MAGHGEKLTRKQEQAIAALLQAPTLKKAAAACGVAEKTLRRWMQLPGFITAWRGARRQAFEAAVAELERHALRAVRTLAKNLKADRPSDQNRAADLLLGHRREYVELEDLARRVTDLEEQQKGNPL